MRKKIGIAAIVIALVAVVLICLAMSEVQERMEPEPMSSHAIRATKDRVAAHRLRTGDD